MPHALTSRSPRLLVLLTAALLALPVLAAPPPAHADDGAAAGDTVVGKVVRAWPEHARPTAAADEGPLTWIKKSDGNAVRVPTSDVKQVPVGATVAVTLGDQVVDKATTHDGLDPAHDVVASTVVAAAAPTAPATSAAGVTNQVTVVVAVPAGGTADGTSVDQVVNLVNGSVHDFWAGQSNGAIQIGATGVPGVLNLSVDCSDPYALWDQAASYAGWSPAANRHLLVYLPKNSPGCAYGLAEVGAGVTSGGELYVTDTVTSVIAHELGHNFGLGHSSETQCDGAIDSGTCQTSAYRDYYDVMAASWEQLGSLTVGQAARIGLLPAGDLQTVTAPAPATTVTLSPVSGRTGTRALKLVDAGKTYWLEYRPAAGQDAWLGTAADWPGLQSGVLLRRDGGDPTSDSSLLLDPTPSRSSNWSSDMQTALPVNQTVSIDAGTFTITVTGVSSTAATVLLGRPWSAATDRFPSANWDGVAVSGTTLSAWGWAFDPDSASATATVHVYVDGSWAGPVAANTSRPDVGAAFPGVGGSHGFGWSGQVSPGVHSVCLYAIDNEQSSRNSPLGCRLVPVAVTPPLGTWDGVAVSGTTLSAWGWAFDPDSASATATVHVYVDGSWAGPVAANTSRPDVGAAFPGVGGSHGFGWSGQVSPGVHSVCLYAIDNEQSSRNSPLGCRRVGVAMSLPLGVWDGVRVSGTTASVWGWAFDPDSPTATTTVHLYVDGAWAGVLPANGSRPDVGAVFPGAGGSHGFGWSGQLGAGTHSLCLYAIDNEVSSSHSALGCRTVTVPGS